LVYSEFLYKFKEFGYRLPIPFTEEEAENLFQRKYSIPIIE